VSGSEDARVQNEPVRPARFETLYARRNFFQLVGFLAAVTRLAKVTEPAISQDYQS
jgi:hypothetical protein